MTKVSVIVPIYNAEKFLHTSLNSILNQTLKDIEVICVNDGSTDKSLEILKQYAAQDDRIVIIDQENKGAGYSRNVGLEIAKGKYLSFLDADDRFEKTMLEKAYNTAEKNSADIVVYKCDLFDANTGEIRPCNWAFKEELIPDTAYFSAKQEDVRDNIFRMFVGWAWDKLFLKEFIIREQITFQDLRTTNDMFFVDYALTRAQRIAPLPEILVHQRVNVPQSLSRKREKSWDCFYKALLLLKQRLEESGDFEIFKRAYVNWTLNLSLWHLNTIGDRCCINVLNLFKTGVCNDLEIVGYDKQYYFEEIEYNDLQKVIEITEQDYLLERLAVCREQMKTLQEDIYVRNKQVQELSHQIHGIYNSATFKVGRIVLCVPKKVFKALKKILHVVMRRNG